MPWRRNLVVGKLSARKARSPLATARDQLSDPSAAHELLAIEAVGYKVANLDHTAVILQRYNNIIHFASRSQRRLQDVQDRHEQIAITRDKILETWHEALKAIRQLEEQLEGEVALQQELIVLEDNPWYRRGDILDLDLDHMSDIFDVYGVKDVHDFRAYLLETITSKIQVETEYDFRVAEDVEDKIAVLCNALEEHHDDYHTFQFLATLNGTVLPSSKALADYHLKGPYIQNRENMQRLLHHAPPEYFLGAAAARRQIWSYYQKMDCEPELCQGDSNHRCYHQLHIRLLKSLTDRAHVEAKSMILLAAGQRLPAELIDLLIEHLLRAEEVPLETAITMGSATEQVQYEMKVLPQYDCGRIGRLRLKEFKKRLVWSRDGHNLEYSDCDHGHEYSDNSWDQR